MFQPMNSLRSIAKIALCSFALAGSNAALAGPVYEFNDNNANTGGAGDYLDSIHATWDAGNEVLHWESVLANSNVDSFWLVINDGPNPKAADTNELVIMYGDLDAGIVTSYVYNGANNDKSYATPGIYLQTDTLTRTGDHISFTIDGSLMNAANIPGDYRGLVAGPDLIGIWYHLAINSSFTYSGNEIKDYSHGAQGWYDKKDLRITAVPAPGALALMGLGLLVLSRTRKQ